MSQKSCEKKKNKIQTFYFPLTYRLRRKNNIGTVFSHQIVTHIYKKLHVASRSEVVVKAIQQGLRENSTFKGGEKSPNGVLFIPIDRAILGLIKNTVGIKFLIKI